MKKDEEAGFFSLINETISNDDINFYDFIVIFKVLSNERIKEEEITNILKQIFLEGGYELKEVKFQLQIDKICEEDIILKGKKTDEKNYLINSLSQLQGFKNNLIICCITPILLFFRNISNHNINDFWEKKIKNNTTYDILSNLKLIYYSDTKIRGLYDSQYMFPNLFKVKHIFQLIISKNEKKNKNYIYLNIKIVYLIIHFMWQK